MDTTPEPAGYGHAEALAHAARETIATMSIADYLAALGSTADAVAETLRRLGITGRPRAVNHCPVANYLREHAGMAHPNVSPRAVTTRNEHVTYVPAPVAGFIRAFDLGYFPDLITPAGDADTGH